MSPEELEDFKDEVDQVHAYYRDEVILAAATDIMQERGLVAVEMATQRGFTQSTVITPELIFNQPEKVQLYTLPLQVSK